MWKEATHLKQMTLIQREIMNERDIVVFGCPHYEESYWFQLFIFSNWNEATLGRYC